MAAKMCSSCKTRRQSNENMAELCNLCYDYAGWENQHQDDNHEGGENLDPDCPVCHGTDPAEIEPKGHSNGIKKSHTSHAACNHPKTKSARAKCRKERDAAPQMKYLATNEGLEMLASLVFKIDITAGLDNDEATKLREHIAADAQMDEATKTTLTALIADYLISE